MNQERKDFEEWANDSKLFKNVEQFEDGYDQVDVEAAWESWQARAEKAKAEPVAWIIRSQYSSRVTENEEVAATFQKVTGGRVEPLYAAPQEPKA